MTATGAFLMLWTTVVRVMLHY